MGGGTICEGKGQFSNYFHLTGKKNAIFISAAAFLGSQIFLIISPHPNPQSCSGNLAYIGRVVTDNYRSYISLCGPGTRTRVPRVPTFEIMDASLDTVHANTTRCFFFSYTISETISILQPTTAKAEHKVHT